MAETLKFGPEWIRALSDSGSGAPPTSGPINRGGSAGQPAAPPLKFKLADHRYSREELLHFYDPFSPVPDGFAEMVDVFVSESTQPLSMTPYSEEEQRLMVESVNSGKPLGRGTFVPRGMGDRGRGRGRGRGGEGGYYGSRPWSQDDEAGGGYSRRRQLSQSEEDIATVPPGEEEKPWRPDYNRSTSSEHWRSTSRNAQTEEEGGRWRKLPQSRDRGRSTYTNNWRDARPPPEDYRGEGRPQWAGGEQRGGGGGGGARGNGSPTAEEDMPEWSMDDGDDVQGTFDAEGAFIPVKESKRSANKGDVSRSTLTDQSTTKDVTQPIKLGTAAKRPDPASLPGDAKLPATGAGSDAKAGKAEHPEVSAATNAFASSAPPSTGSKSFATSVGESGRALAPDQKLAVGGSKPLQSGGHAGNGDGATAKAAITKPLEVKAVGSVGGGDGETALRQQQTGLPGKVGSLPGDVSNAPAAVKPAAMVTAVPAATSSIMQSVLPDTVVPTPTANPTMLTKQQDVGVTMVDHSAEDNRKWLYKDPQGQVQGPFDAAEMAEWFSAGYFAMDLLVKRPSDDAFLPLGDWIKRVGRLPFLLAGPAQPVKPAEPIVVAPGQGPVVPGAEALDLIMQQMVFAQQQYVQQQQLLRQQHLQQLMQTLQQHDNFLRLNADQQQQYVMTLMMGGQQAAVAAAAAASPILQALLQQQQLQVAQLAQQQQIVLSQLQHKQMLAQQQLAMSGAPEQQLLNLHLHLQAAAQLQQQQQQLANVPAPAPAAPSLTAPTGSLMDRSQPDKAQAVPILASAAMGSAGPQGQGWTPSIWDLDQSKVLSVDEVEKMQLEESRQQEKAAAAASEKPKDKRKSNNKKKEDAVPSGNAVSAASKKQEEERLALEARRLEVEAQRLAEEESKRLQEEEERKRAEKEAKENAAAQERKRREAEKQARKREEQERKQQQEEARRAEEEARRAREEEEKRLRRVREEEEKRLRREAEEEARRRQQQEELQRKTESAWGGRGKSAAQTSNAGLSLAQIQQLEAEKQRKEQEEERKNRSQMDKMAAQEQKKSTPWSDKSGGGAVSLVHIQQEEARLASDNKAAARKAPKQPMSSSIPWSGADADVQQQTSRVAAAAPVGFWDSAVATAGSPASRNSISQKDAVKGQAQFPALSGSTDAGASSNVSGNKGKTSKLQKDEETVQRLFNSMKPKDEFTQWCADSLRGLPSEVDIPTFVNFLLEIENPDEVRDYVYSYLGESRAANDFVSKFLERRSQLKAGAKAQGGAADKPSANKANSGLQQQKNIAASAQKQAPKQQQQVVADDADDGWENEGAKGSKGKKKKKMQKLDKSCLGFSVVAAEGRIVGELDSVKQPTS